jgi:tripartite-type tricarboxylate transporter receptor subunit TctC
MKPTRRHLVAAASAGLAVGGTGGLRCALAQAIAKPLLARPARIMVGFAAGGGTDLTARILAEAMRGTYASSII